MDKSIRAEFEELYPDKQMGKGIDKYINTILDKFVLVMLTLLELDLEDNITFKDLIEEVMEGEFARKAIENGIYYNVNKNDKLIFSELDIIKTINKYNFEMDEGKYKEILIRYLTAVCEYITARILGLGVQNMEKYKKRLTLDHVEKGVDNDVNLNNFILRLDEFKI